MGSSTVTLPVEVYLPERNFNLKLCLGLEARLASKGTKNSIHRGVAAEEAGSLQDRVTTLEREMRELKNMQHELLNTQHELLNTNRQTKAQLAVLQDGSAEFAKILRRSLVEDAQAFLLKSAGPRQEVEGALEHWETYIDRIFKEKGYRWFAQQEFPLKCLALLHKGTGTPFDTGSRAAHELRSLNPDVFGAGYLQGLPDQAQPSWKELYDFLQAQEREALPSSTGVSPPPDRFPPHQTGRLPRALEDKLLSGSQTGSTAEATAAVMALASRSQRGPGARVGVRSG